MPNFTDDSSRFGFKDILFFSWKYYCHLLEKDDNYDKSKSTFADVDFSFDIPKDMPSAQITLHAGGDLMPYSWIQERYCPHLWDDIGDRFFAADLVIANLETPILLSKPKSLVPEVMLNEMHFNADRQMFGLFNGQNKYKGFDFLSTANNHSMDMGEEGVNGSIEFLRSKGIRQHGIASKAEDAIAPVYIEIKGIRFAFMSWTYSLNKCKVPDDKPWMVNHLRVNESGVDLSPIIAQAREAKINGKADVLILSLHYGNAYQSYPAIHIRENTSRIFCEAGIDLI
ncbi:MAG: CapA family protein, partial [Saprospiraceae bacterium]